MDKIFVKEIIAPICIILGAMVFYGILVKIINKVLKLKKNTNKKHETIKKLIVNVIRYIIIIISILMILEVYGIDTKSLVASLGVVGLVIGLALQDMIKDFVAGAMIVFEDSYNVGDVVTINGFKGDVIDLGVKTTKIKSVDGDIKIINNGTITEIINHSISNSLVSLEVSVAYESDIKQVEKVLTKFCERVSKENDDIKEDLTLLGITNLGESGITFKMVGYVTNGKQFEIQRKLNMLVKLELDKHNITIPYPHMVIVNE